MQAACSQALCTLAIFGSEQLARPVLHRSVSDESPIELGSVTLFGKEQLSAMSLEDYPPQGPLAVNEAKIILPLLEKSGIRFQINTDPSCSESDQGPFVDARVELYVHSEDVEAWIKIRDRFWKP